MSLQFTDVKLASCLLRSESENHPTDDEVEQKNRIHSKSFAIWRLAISKKSCGG
jgi:hypothetical protein